MVEDKTLGKDVKILTSSYTERKEALEKAIELGYTLLSGNKINPDMIETLCKLEFVYICLRTDKHPIHKNFLLGSHINIGYSMAEYNDLSTTESMSLDQLKSL